MQLGFVIDHSRCIGCHACTVACKSENGVPVGDFRTWVKYTEQGTFPEVRRSFAVLRCNQCTDAPCVTICPVTALDKRSDGIVDIDPKVCIGCKACMHGCPYDALYINEDKGTAEKCHFCAHRTERGLAPACAVVCPTEAIIPGDFHDPDSRVSQMQRQHALAGRKTEAGTGPNVLYRDADASGLDPSLTNLSTGSIWTELPTGERVDAQLFEAMEHKAEARTVYDVPRKQLWGSKITGYLFTKSIAAGVFPIGALALAGSGDSTTRLLAVLALVALTLTGLLLIADLKRPERFLYILIRPNWNSWLARGTYAIVAYSGLLAAWLLFAPELAAFGYTLFGLTVVAAAVTAAYTGWLFSQAKGRVLWMKRWYWLHLLVQAALAGSATLLVLAPLFDLATGALRWALVASLAGQLAFALTEHRMAPARREAEYARASALVSHGPYAQLHRRVGLLVGLVLPAGCALAFGAPWALAGCGLAALIGLWVEEDIFVRAGQALPIS